MEEEAVGRDEVRAARALLGVQAAAGDRTHHQAHPSRQGTPSRLQGQAGMAFPSRSDHTLSDRDGSADDSMLFVIADVGRVVYRSIICVCAAMSRVLVIWVNVFQSLISQV